MPYVSLTIGKKLTNDTVQLLQSKIADQMPLIPGKTCDNTMIHIAQDASMFMSKTQLPCIHMDIRLMGAAPMENKVAFVKAISELLEETLEIEKRRMYINIQEFDHWGSNGTFR